jgi:hypothetical protein
MKIFGVCKQISYLVLSVLVCCNDKKINQYESTQLNYPVILDACHLASIDRNEVNMQSGYYYPLYIGEITDTIAINKLKYSVTHFMSDYRDGRDYSYPEDSSVLKIFIDTTRFICYTEKSYGKDTFSLKYYNGYPLILLNNSSDTVRVASGPFIPAKLEALTPEGKWQAIEQELIPMDENGLNRLFLPPRYTVICAIPVYKGDFDTKLRLKFRNFTSAPFSGSINITQLDINTYKNNFID